MYKRQLLTVDHADTEKVAKYIADARRLGITVAPPALNRAMLNFTIEDDDRPPTTDRRKTSSGSGRPSAVGGRSTIRYGLAAIKNAGEGAVQLLIDERQANGPFKDPIDLSLIHI